MLAVLAVPFFFGWSNEEREANAKVQGKQCKAKTVRCCCEILVVFYGQSISYM